MSENKNIGAKPQLTQEQIKQLMAMMQNQKPASKYQQYLQKAIASGIKLAQDLTVKIDKFIKFVIHKEEEDRDDVVQNARGPILFGTYVIIIFVIIGGLWSAMAPLDTAATAIGTVIPSSKRKMIQHPSGGIIKQIYVQVGDRVKAGDKIIDFDDINFKAQYESSLNQYRAALAATSRWIAERDDLKEIQFDEFLLKDKEDAKVSVLLKTEKELFESREEAYKKRVESLEQRHLQLGKQLEGLEARKISSEKNSEVMKDRLKAATELYNSGHLNRAQFLDMDAKAASATSELATNESEIARIKQAMLQDEAEILNFKNSYVADIIDNLNKYQSGVNEARERYTQAKDAFDRSTLRSPVDGTVIEMQPTTVGGVVGGGQALAEILPTGDLLVIEARIPSKNIDSVTVGLRAKIRFSAFKSRTSPVFNGVVTSLSPDVIQDKQPQMMQNEGPTYLARIDIDMEDFNKMAKKGKLVLRPGMQAEVQIVTGTKTLLRYLLDPITDNMFKAFKEK